MIYTETLRVEKKWSLLPPNSGTDADSIGFLQGPGGQSKVVRVWWFFFPYGGFHSHGGSPIAGWFMENPSINGWELGVPLFQESAISVSWFYMRVYNKTLLNVGWGRQIRFPNAVCFYASWQYPQFSRLNFSGNILPYIFGLKYMLQIEPLPEGAQKGIRISQHNFPKFIWVWVNTYRYIFSGLFTSIFASYDLGFTARYQGFDP